MWHNVQGCLTEVHTRLEHAVNRLRLPQWPRGGAAAWKPAAVLQARRFGKALRLLRAIAAFDGVLMQGSLVSLAFDGLISCKVSKFHPASSCLHALALQRPNTTCTPRKRNGEEVDSTCLKVLVHLLLIWLREGLNRGDSDLHVDSKCHQDSS
jgi:hypothetical protein